jgi:serine/threonine-protein kinase
MHHSGEEQWRVLYNIFNVLHGFLAAGSRIQVLELSLSCMKREPRERPRADELVEQCGTLCYNTAPRIFGTIRRMEYGKYGFINSDAGDVFFHIESFYGPDRPKAGDTEMFSSYPGGGAPRAYPMVKVAP